MTSAHDIVIASNNAGKLREFQALLIDTKLKLVPQVEYHVPEAKETGLTFIENALIKARNACHFSGLPSIGDDSGLEVDFLQGAPGIRSSRFAGENATDSDNMEKLLDALEKVPLEKRTARFQCALTYLRFVTDPAPLISLGTWEGCIGLEKRGENGFGYDPIFIVSNMRQTSAELDMEVKNVLSHRGQALRSLAMQLRIEYAA